MKIFSDVASLEAATLTAGQLVETKGYYESGDGGQARYLIQTAAEYGGTPDGYGNIELANGNVAVLQYEGSVNVKQFGATGDGSTDDTDAIQAVIDYAIDDGFKSILISGKHNITGTLNIDKGIIHTEDENDYARKRLTFIGEGEAEILKENVGFMFSASVRSGDIAFENITFSGTIDNTGISSIVTGLKCFDCDKLIRISTTNCTFRYIDDVWYQSGTSATNMQSVKSINDTYTKNYTILKFNNAWDVVFDGGLMEDGHRFLGCVDVNSTIRSLVVGSGCTVEGMQGTAIDLNCVHYGTKIDSSYFEANTNHIQMRRYNLGVSITNNSFFGRGSIDAGDTVRCIDVAVGDFPMIVDGNISTETNVNTILIYVDETSVYNVAGRNLIGNNGTSGSTLVDPENRYVNLANIGEGFQHRWATWTPTLNWTGATPTGVTTKAAYKKIGTTVFIKVNISCTDGNNATNMTMTLPFTPKTENRFIYIPAYQAIGAGVSTRFVYVRDNGVDDYLTWLYMGTATSGQTFKTTFELSYEVE